MSGPALRSESEALELIRKPLSLLQASSTLPHLQSIFQTPLFPNSIRTQAANRCFDWLESLVAHSALEDAVLPSVLTALSALKSLPEEISAELGCSLESAVLMVETAVGDKGFVREVEGLVAVGKALKPDSDAVFSLGREQVCAIVGAMQACRWEEALDGMDGLFQVQSPTIAAMVKTTVSTFPSNPELFPRLERFLTDHFTYFPAPIQSELQNLYVSQCESLKRPISPVLNPNPSLSDALNTLISAVIRSQASDSPSTPAKVKEDIKQIATRCKVKDPMEVFTVLKTCFTEVTEAGEIEACMVVLRAVQLSKNLSAGKMSDLYNALHKKTPAKGHKGSKPTPKSEPSKSEIEAKTAQEDNPQSSAPPKQAKPLEEDTEDYLLDVPLFDPTDLPQILALANKNVYSVLQTYMAKRSEFLKCVALFQKLNQLIAEDLPGYHIHTFGSLSEGTWTKYSTVDITLFNEEVVEYVSPLSKLMERLKEHPDIKVEAVFKSKYPVLRVKRADSYFWVNITINNVMGREIAKLLSRYLSLDPRVAHMVTYVKIWAHINSINQSKIGLPSGYSWTLLVLHFLMTIGFLPCLQAKEHVPVYKENCDVWVDEEPYEITDKRSVGHLLMLFFYHYGVAIPSMSCLLDLRTGRLDSIQPGPVLYPLIQPFEESRPLFTLHRNKDTGRKVVNTMRKAYTHLVRQSEVIRLN